MAIPCSLQASIVSSSRREPPGWMIAVTPCDGREVRAVAEREESVGRENRAVRSRPGFLNGDTNRVEPAHLAGAHADELKVLGQHDRVGFHARTDPPGEVEVLRVRPRRACERSRPGRRSGRARRHPRSARAIHLRLAAGRGRRGRDWPGPMGDSRSSRRTLLRQLGLVVSQSSASGSNPGASIASMNRPGWHIRSAEGEVDRPVESDDTAECARRVALVRPLERGGWGIGQGGAAGIVMLEDAGRR